MCDTGINMGCLLIETGAPLPRTPLLKKSLRAWNKESFRTTVITVHSQHSANWKSVRLEGLSRVTVFNSVRTVTRTGHGLGLRNDLDSNLKNLCSRLKLIMIPWEGWHPSLWWNPTLSFSLADLRRGSLHAPHSVAATSNTQSALQ